MSNEMRTYLIYIPIFIIVVIIDITWMPAVLDHVLEGAFIGHLIARVAAK